MITNPNNASTVYNQHPWMMPAPTVENQAKGPDQSNPERIANNKIQAALLQQSPAPPVVLFRPRFGYRVDAYGIEDILNVDTVFPPPNPGSWWSGGPSETNSSSTYSNYSATFGNL